MNKFSILLCLLISLFIFSCSTDDSNESNNNNGGSNSQIDVTINGVDYTFNNITVIKHFEGTPNDDEFPDWFEVEAKVDNSNDVVIDFDVALGHTGDWEAGTIIGEFNLATNNGGSICNYYGVNIEYPLINVTVNNEEEFRANFSFTNNFGGVCSDSTTFGDQVTYENGTIYISL